MITNLKTDGWTIVDNFLKEDIYKEIIQFVNSYEDNWVDSSTVFPDYLLVDDKVEVEGKLKVTENNHWNYFKSDNIIGKFQNQIINYLKENINLNPDDILPNFRTRIHKYDNKSALLWHTDKRDFNTMDKHNSNFGYACTLYLNDIWKSNWGGEILVGDGRWIKPKKNRLFIVDTNVPHKVNMIMKGADIRVSLQTFFTMKKSLFYS